MARKYRDYTDEQVVQKCKEVNSMAELLKALDLRVAGGNYNNMRKTLQRLNLDCSHWSGSAWNAGQRLKDWSEYNKLSSLKPHLIKERGHKCERCRFFEWQGEKIPLEVEHANGDRSDNRKENLLLLCCNCHALTPTWRGRKMKTSSYNCICEYTLQEFDYLKQNSYHRVLEVSQNWMDNHSKGIEKLREHGFTININNKSGIYTVSIKK